MFETISKLHCLKNAPQVNCAKIRKKGTNPSYSQRTLNLKFATISVDSSLPKVVRRRHDVKEERSV